MDANIQEFSNHLETEKGSSENTVAAYRNDLNQFNEFLTKEGGLPEGAWGDLSRDQLINYILWLKEREYASATVARKVAAMKSFCGFLVRSGAVEDNPADELDSPKVKKQLPTTLTPDEVEKLLALPAHGNGSPKALRDTALLEVLYATGMRVSEVANLTLDDLDLAAGTVRCVGKGNKERVMPLYAEACSAVRRVSRKGPAGAVRLERRGAHAVPQPAGREADAPGPVVDHQGVCAAARPRRSGHPAHAAPLVRHAHAQRRGRAARGAEAAGPRQHLHHPGLHPHQPGAPARSLRRRASKGVSCGDEGDGPSKHRQIPSLASSPLRSSGRGIWSTKFSRGSSTARSLISCGHGRRTVLRSG